MSLKAKLEAVIYAAEEPVTLGQLAVLFADEALQWKAEQETEEAEAAVTVGGATMPLLNNEFSYLEAASEAVPDGEEETPEAPIPTPEAMESTATAEIEPEAEPAAEPEAAIAESETAGAGEEITDESAPEGREAEAADKAAEPAAESAAPEAEAAPEIPAENAAEAELEAKRQARQRDREVRAILRQILDGLIDEYASDERGIEIREIAGGYRMATKPECHDAVRAFVKSLKPALKLSLPALETLAVIAYKQPITAPEVNEIRGVDSSGVFGSLLARKLIATAGRKQVIGRPILYKTTREFLLRFGLKDVSELPSMEEFEKMAASELDEPETAAEQQGSAANGQAGAEFVENVPEDQMEQTAPAADAFAAESAAAEPEAGDIPEPAPESVSAAVVETPVETATEETSANNAPAEPVNSTEAESTLTEAENIAADTTAAEAEAESTRA